MSKFIAMKYFFIICLIWGSMNFHAEAQQKHEQLKFLKSEITITVLSKCHLTGLSTRKEIQINKDTLFIPLIFNNESLRTFWSPEVAVEYIFDAALAPILYRIWSDTGSIFNSYEKIAFNIDIRPHDIPPVLLFEIHATDWYAYQKNCDKIVLYENITITSAGMPYKFDARKAFEVE